MNKKLLFKYSLSDDMLNEICNILNEAGIVYEKTYGEYVGNGSMRYYASYFHIFDFITVEEKILAKLLLNCHERFLFHEKYYSELQKI